MRNREEKKKCKGQESTIGKIIYGFLLFLPLLAIGVTCGYAMFNKNAYRSYSDELVENTIDLSSIDQVANNLEIIVYKNDTNNTTSSFVYGFKSINLDLEELTGVTTPFNAINFLDDRRIQFRVQDWTNNTGTNLFTINNRSETDVISFVSDGNTYMSGGTHLLSNAWSFKIISYATQKLDNVFYYAVDKVQQSPLFNWAENSIIYTTTSTTCNALSITTPFIPLLMSYWLIISIIYFLYDIALMLVWILHRKIHELQESI